VCGLPEVHERLKRSDRGERSRTRNGTMRKMLRGESWTCFVGASQFNSRFGWECGDGYYRATRR
jgi:hypothetical protein